MDIEIQDNIKSEDEFEEKENEFKCIRRQSINDFIFCKAKI